MYNNNLPNTYYPFTELSNNSETIMYDFMGNHFIGEPQYSYTYTQDDYLQVQRGWPLVYFNNHVNAQMVQNNRPMGQPSEITHVRPLNIPSNRPSNKPFNGLIKKREYPAYHK